MGYAAGMAMIIRPTPMNAGQLAHIDRTMRKAFVYLQRLSRHLGKTQHDERHPFYRKTAIAMQAVYALSNAAAWLYAGYGSSLDERATINDRRRLMRLKAYGYPRPRASRSIGSNPRTASRRRLHHRTTSPAKKSTPTTSTATTPAG